jgi:hypothetical protein
MASREVCRHGLLTLERNGVRIHAHDGSICQTAKPAAPPVTPPVAPPDPVSQPIPSSVAVESVPPQAAAVETEAHSRAPLAYETVLAAEDPAPDAVEVEPTPARRSRPWLLVGALLAVLLLIGAGVAGGLVARNAVDREKDRTVAAQRRAASLKDELANKNTTIDGQQDQIAGYERQQEVLRQREEQLAQRERALEQPQGPNATSFSDGIFQARVAIQPGEYRTEGTDQCYWAKLSTGDTNSIIENDFVAGPQTVTVDSPYFESENCGTWTKVTSE